MATATDVNISGSYPTLLSIFGTANNQGPQSAFPTLPTLEDIDPTAGGSIFFFKMRADASPGPGYVVWVVTGEPDFAGTFAPSPIVPGSVIHVSTWT